MKTKTLVLVAVAVLVLGGCRNGETPLTGAYGSGLLSGHVVLESGSSPAGVEVSVMGTGMRVEVGEDGGFTFMGVPGNAELQFTRGDGISSKLRVERPTSDLVVTLSAAGAQGRRRGVGRSAQYEGLVTEVGATTLKVMTSHKVEVEFAVEDSTVIRKGNRDYELSELQPDWRVHVKAITKEGVLTALEIKVQNTGDDDDDDGDDEGSTMTANGPVLSKGSDGSLVVFSQPKGEVTVQTDGSTIIKRQGERITVDDISVGDEINSMGTRVDDHTLLARQIEVRGNSKKPKH